MGKFLSEYLTNNTVAVKTITRDYLLSYVKENVQGSAKNQLQAWIPTVHTIQNVHLQLPIGLTAQQSVTALLLVANVNIVQASAPLVPLAAGNYVYKDFVKVLKRIAYAEDSESSIIATQSERTAGPTLKKHFSMDFLLKHAQDTVSKAAAVAVERFTATNRFAGVPALPATSVSQNLERKSFEDFRELLIKICVEKDLFETVEKYVEEQADRLLKAGSYVA